MLTVSMEHQAQIDQTFPVYVKGMNRRAPGRRSPDDQGRVFAPGKVLAPSLLARMKQGSKETGFRIDALYFVVLVIVAGLARESQIVQIGCAIPAFGDNMFSGERVYCVVLAAAAEFTPMMRSLCDGLFETPGNGASTHAAPARVRASVYRDRYAAVLQAQTRL